MINTRKASNTIKRSMTAMLAAVTVMTTAASFTASADAAQAFTSINTSTAMTVRKAAGNPDYGKTGDTAFTMASASAIKAIDGGLELLLAGLPLKSVTAPAIKAGLLYLIGLGCERSITTNELSQTIDELEDAVCDALDEQTKKLISSMESAFTTGTYKSDLKGLADSTKIAEAIIDNDDEGPRLNEQERLVKLAMVVGNSETWDENGKLIKQIKAVASDLTGSNAMDKRDMFEMLYESNKHKYKFSGEVIDAVDPYAIKTIIDYIKSAGIALASLSAQQQVLSNGFKAENIKDASLKKKYLSLHNDPGTIRNMQIRIAQSLFGTSRLEENGIKVRDRSIESIIDHYTKFKAKYRAIYIPSGKDLSTNLQRVDGSRLIDNNEEKTRNFGNWHLEGDNKKDFADRIQKGGNSGITNALTEKEIRDLVEYIREHNGGDVRGFLEKMGFNFEAYGDARIITGGGYHETLNTDAEKRSVFARIMFANPIVTKTWDTSFDALNINKGKIEEVQWKRNTRRAALAWLCDGGHSCEIKNDSKILYMFKTASADEVAAKEKASYENLTAKNSKS